MKKLDVFKKKKDAKKDCEDVISIEETMSLLERIIIDDLDKIISLENAVEESRQGGNNSMSENLNKERKLKIDEVLKLSDKYNDLAKMMIENKKVDKIPEKGFTKVIETIKATGTILTTGMQIITFNKAFDKVGVLEQTGRWTSMAFKKLPWPRMN